MQTKARKRRFPGWLPIISFAVIVGIGLGLFLLNNRSSGGFSETASIAGQASEGSVRVLSGRHKVLHSEQPLPTASAPRADGKYTVVWFSGTWCHFCEQMEGFAHPTAAEFSDRFVFVEKSVDHDRQAASRYGVRGTPTFVVVDATGKEVSRFGFQRSADAFRSILAAVPAGPNGT